MPDGTFHDPPDYHDHRDGQVSPQRRQAQLAYLPLRFALAAAVQVRLPAPLLAPTAALICLLILGLPAYGSLFTPATALLSDGAQRQQLNQGLGFGLGNLAGRPARPSPHRPAARSPRP